MWTPAANKPERDRAYRNRSAGEREKGAMEIFYHIIVISVAAIAAFMGWRRGFSAQSSAILGLTFGIVAARVAYAEAVDVVVDLGIVKGENCRMSYAAGIVGSSAVFALTYLIVDALTGVIAKLLRPLGFGLLNSLGGALYCVFESLVWTSIALNMLLSFKPDCGLERYGDKGDGDAVASVMVLAPALLGSEDVTDLWHSCRLRDAQKIS